MDVEEKFLGAGKPRRQMGPHTAGVAKEIHNMESEQKLLAGRCAFIVIGYRPDIGHAG